MAPQCSRGPGASRDVAPEGAAGNGAAESAPDACVVQSPRVVRVPAAPVKILFVAANAEARDALALDEEYRQIENALRAGRHRDAFQLIPQLAARRGDLQRALLEHRPAVVHFACHGSAEAEVLLRGDGPAAEAVPADAIAALFQVLRDNLVLVVFNACFAAGQALAICRYAGTAIGMRTRIDDRAATAFAVALYEALAFGRSIRDAFDLGAAAVAAVNPAQRGAPQLFVEPGIDAGRIHLAGGRRARWPRIAAVLLAAAAVALAWHVARRSGSDAPSEPLAGSWAPREPAPGMVRFAGSERSSGMHTATPPAACAVPDEIDACGGTAHRAALAATAVAPFELDALEVSNADYARWLTQQLGAWLVTAKGVIKTHREPGVALALISERCGGGLNVTGDGRIVAVRDQAAQPVVCVTWHGAAEYCRAHHKRLPLEAEWDLAAGARGGRAFPWGGEPPRDDGVAFNRRDGAAAHPSDAGNSPQDVSSDGVRDLGGNAAEWVDDERGLDDSKTIRGGSWASRGPCRVLSASCKRVALDASGPYGPDVGFRCARSVIEAPRPADARGARSGR
jgi:formylglycine-generating enzyme required for sulfatase activity